jgi:small subunit ribosomal protein S2
LADPSTWPKQAQMAVEGNWDRLQEYKDFLKGGKE